MEQVMTYCVINQTIFNREELNTIKEEIYKYMAWHAIDIYEEVETRLENPINISMPAPFYNPAKGIPWLFREWPQIEHYLHLGDMRDTITDETAMTLNEQQIEELEKMVEQSKKQQEEEEEEEAEEEKQEPDDFEEIEAAAFKQQKLKEDLAKKNKAVRDKLGLGKTASKKRVQFEDLPKEGKPKKGKNLDKGKGKGKEAEKDQSTSGEDDLGNDSSSSSESSNGKGSDSEDESESNTRNYHQAKKNGNKLQEKRHY